MSRKFITALSGTYNVHANEVARGASFSGADEGADRSATLAGNNLGGRLSNLSALITGRSVAVVPETIKCVVHFLDDTEHIFEVDRSAKGEVLMDAVFRHLELIEREYFALQFTEIFHHHHHGSPLLAVAAGNGDNDHNHPLGIGGKTNMAQHGNAIVYNKWLDPTKKIRKQMRYCQPPFLLHFRVKFYVTEMSRLLEEYTRYHFYLQLRKDILSGRLTMNEHTDSSSEHHESIMSTLASYVLQSELGDFSEEDHQPGYSKHINFIPNQTEEFCQKVESLHRLHQGQTPADAELNYLEEAKHLELYGVDLHHAKDCQQQDINIGVSSNGLTVYKNNVKINSFSWAKIVKISFKRRYFFIQLKHEGTERFDNMIGFNLCSYRACKSLWKSCVEQHTFFRLHTPKPLTKKFFFFFSLGSKFRYSGKTEFQTIEENRKRLTRTERIFIRNNARNATMPASFHDNTRGEKAAITEAQKHIVNLKLSTIANDIGRFAKNSANAANGAIAHHHPQPRRPHSPLSSLDSTTGSRTSSSTSMSSLLGGNNHNRKKTAYTQPPTNLSVAGDSTKSNQPTLSLEPNGDDGDGGGSEFRQPRHHPNRHNECTVLSSANHSSHLTSGPKPIHSKKMTITEDASAAVLDIQTDKSASHQSEEGKRPLSNVSSSSSSSSSMESSFSPMMMDDGGKPNQPKMHDLQLCDTLNVVAASTNGVKHDNSRGIAGTIITIGQASNTKTGEAVGSMHRPSTFSAAAAAYTPSTLISLPYIDSSSTTSDKTPSIVSNGSQSTIKDDYDGDVNADGDTLLKKFDYDSPIRELIKELYNGAALGTNVDEEAENAAIASDAESPVHVVTVTMKPDSEGRFGFNVKGGDDQNCPVLVSRVLPNTPADNALPTKLHEGDQVLAINGRQVTGLKHEEVVQLIRSTKDLGPEAKLVLSIRPNVYYKRCGHDECDATADESPFHYTPAADTAIGRQLSGGNDSSADLLVDDEARSNSRNELPESHLDTSMSLLHEGLQGDLLIIQFDYLPRRNDDEPITVARYLDNVPKNRYLDIAPYDSTRVVLKECITGDYINASFVTMNVEASNVVNRYIATQGPLKRTTSDFWQMVWEQKSTLIVMVTPLVEEGRKKCFKYWPDEDETLLVNDCIDLVQESCEDREAFLERTFKMTDQKTGKTHHVVHLQYLAWPDQGVPDECTDFLKLIFKVREIRTQDPDPPVIVHCSAGIGRTGVLILMETGICLIEANQPVYPLELVRQMRSQRAMLIQTSNQFRFVCEALYSVYRDQLVKPLAQYLHLK